MMLTLNSTPRNEEDTMDVIEAIHTRSAFASSGPALFLRRSCRSCRILAAWQHREGTSNPDISWFSQVNR